MKYVPTNPKYFFFNILQKDIETKRKILRLHVKLFT